MNKNTTPSLGVAVIGASSGIAEGVARAFAASDHARFFLAGRSQQKMDSLAADLSAHGASSVTAYAGDYLQPAMQQAILLEAEKRLGRIDVLLLAWGLLGKPGESKNVVAAAEEMIQVNLTSYVTILTLAANFFKDKKGASIAVITSVAGDRGRATNYVYDSAKAAVSTYLEGFRQRMYKYGVHVLTIKPGWVATPMTAHIRKQTLFASTEYVGEKIRTAIIKKKDILYVPWPWRFVMLLLRTIPEFIFKRLGK